MADYTDNTDEVGAQDVPYNPQVSVSGKADLPTGKPYPGLSPLKAGLLYGGAAATVMGPLGILVGLGAGIEAKRMKDNYLDKQAREMRSLGGESSSLIDEINSQKRISDPDQQRLLEHAKMLTANGWYRLQSGDETGRDLIAQANNITQGIMQGNIDSRNRQAEANHAFQTNLIGGAANDYRSQFQQNVEQATNIEQQAMRVLGLANEEGFDPNKPFNKAILAELLSTGINGMYKDAPDMLDAIGKGTQALSHIPVVGGAAADVADAILTGFKSKQFEVTKEDYNRIALNMKQYNTQYTQMKMQQLGGQTKALDQFANQIGVLPQGYSLSDYVSGKITGLKFAPPPQVPTIERKEAPKAAPKTGYNGPNFIQQPFKPAALPGQFGVQGELWQDPNVLKFLQGHQRPTN
jgi:hypothetical protein